MTDKQKGSAEPILALLRRKEESVTNSELGEAIGFVNSTRKSKLVTGHWTNVVEELREETRLLELPSDRFGRRRSVRVFSKFAVVRVALRARTDNAKAFQLWLAARAVEREVWNA